MIKSLLSKRKLLIICAIALFNFIFLGTEYLYDNMMAYVTDAQGVVVAQSYILGASVIGFLLFAGLQKKVLPTSWTPIGYAGAVSCVICIFVIQQHASYASILIAGLIVFCLMGIAGSAVCYLVTLIIENRKHLAKHVGVAYALGIFIQFINNNLVKSDLLQSVVIAVFFAAFVAIAMLMRTEFEQKADDLPKQESMSAINKPKVAGVALILCVLLMTCIFSTLDNAVTLVHAAGEFDIGQWPRLLLAVSGLMAGFLYDIRERRYMNLIMYVVTLLSTSCVVLIQMGGSFVVGLLAFYLSAGFFVVFFMTSFMDLSYSMKLPALWAGLGRAINNLCAVLTGTISTMLLATGSGMIIMITALLLFAAISICVAVYAAQITPVKEMAEPETVTVVKMVEIDPEEKFVAFAEAFALTKREKEVLKVLLESEENVQEIAEILALSRAALYRHIASLNEKTNTKSRIGIMQFYYNWKPN